MTFNILNRRVAETAQIELNDAEGGPLLDDDRNRLSVTLCGPGSKTWQRADAERNRRQAARAEKNMRKIATTIADHRLSDQIDFLVAITVSFNGWEYPHPDRENGGSYPSQRDMFKAAYSDDSIGYIRDQLAAEGNDWSAFRKTVSTPSAPSPDSLPG